MPLLIHVPGFSENEVIFSNPVELVDLFPTLVDLTQVSEPLKRCAFNKSEILCTEGRSLVPSIFKKSLNKVSTHLYLQISHDYCHVLL